MTTPIPGITIRFRLHQDRTYRIDLRGPQGEDYTGEFVLPHTPATWTAVLRALELGFSLSLADTAA